MRLQSSDFRRHNTSQTKLTASAFKNFRTNTREDIKSKLNCAIEEEKSNYIRAPVCDCKEERQMRSIDMSTSTWLVKLARLVYIRAEALPRVR